MTYTDPRLVAIYDTDNPDGPDHDYFRRLADATPVHHITDLGCGTGILTVTLAGGGRRVVGIDPSRTMLARAAARPGGDAVEWRIGTSEQIEPSSTDLVIMSGNVSMHILGDEWHQTLHDITRGLRPGGRLAFESRNPHAEQWREWNSATSERRTPAGRLRESMITDPPDNKGIVTMHCYNNFIDDGDTVEVTQHLQFRDLTQISADLDAAGLRTLKVSCDWSGTRFTDSTTERLMVFEATVP